MVVGEVGVIGVVGVELVEWEVGLVGKGFRLKFLNYRIIRLTGVRGTGVLG